MKTSIYKFLIVGMGSIQFLSAQESQKTQKRQEFPFTHQNWKIENADGSQGEIKIVTFKNKSGIKLEPNQKVLLKNKEFKNFILEFYCNGLSGPGLGFRVQDRNSYEYLYLRLGLSGKKDALQYIPIYNGSLPWQLYNYPKYEGKAVFPREKVATLPIDLKSELIQGKAGNELRSFLLEKGFSFSQESEIALSDDINYIYDPNEAKALLFEEVDDDIVFLDPRTWIHVKVEVKGDTASFYIDDVKTPALVVENLKRDAMVGGISLIGDGAEVYFADVSIKEIRSGRKTEEYVAKEKLPSEYLTKWNVSEMFAKDSVNFVSQVDSLIQYEDKFRAVEADSDGLINISRFYDDMTKTVVLTCNLISDADKTVQLYFDYADHLVLLLNTEVLFDKGMNFQPPPEKGEEGRVFVNDESVELSLKKGTNRLTFMLSADNRQKFNWGFVAKLEENLEGIVVE
ncbi:hypothetical protein [Maribacter sp. 4G9]|uniref:hypothetical protein n=1 Tax=Maribacter sp. 4G9 TaxID=1889777 RepID=UPI000C154590|nr:hypothetical protein [Maribacter sp. 4G9]PIB31438.1 hypothetical protein BFP75_01440 [Maribacter sp. 4G9]